MADEWNVVSNYLKVDAKVEASIAEEVNGFITDVKLRQIVLDAILGKVPEDFFKGLVTFAKVVSQQPVRLLPHSVYPSHIKVAYDWFNPQTIIIEMARCANNDRTWTGDDMYEFSADGITYKVPKRCVLVKDVEMFATLFLVRGNNLHKFLPKFGKDAKKAISAKIAAYCVKSDVDQEAAAWKRNKRTILSSKDITLSRIAASFPHLTLAIAKQKSIPSKARCTAIRLQYGINNCRETTPQMPCVLQHGLLPALLSKEEPQDEQSVRQFCYMFHLEQTITLQTPHVMKAMIHEPLETQTENSMKFVSAAIINRLLTPDIERIKLRKALFKDNEDEITKWIAAGASAWIKTVSAATYYSLITTMKSDAAAVEERAGPST